jgi:uncharacterized protein YvpB
MDEQNKRYGSIGLTVLGALFAVLICISATGLIIVAFPQSGLFLRLLLSPLQQDNTIVSGMVIDEPTPFMPLPTETPTATPTEIIPTATPTPVPTATAIPNPVPPPSEGAPPTSAYISGFKGSPQLYTLDCESQAAVDWARHFGVSINEQAFIDQLPISDDPEEGFVGYINGPMGQVPPGDYGVYPGPVAALLREYGLNAAAVENWDINSLKHEIAAGRPVIVWIVNLPFAVSPREYTASNGNTTIVAPFQHTWIVTGYNSASFTIVDSEWTYNVLTQTFIERWNALGKRAIVMVPAP